MKYPPRLDWIGGSIRGRKWLDGLPQMVETLADQWNLDVGLPFPDSFVSLVLPAERNEAAVVLKIQYPGRESAPEAEALRLWDGGGAVRLIEEDRTRHALLLERCEPGTPLSEEGPTIGMDVLVGLLPRLWVPASPAIPTLAEEVERWVRSVPIEYATAGEPFERSLVDGAIETLVDLASTQGEQVLVNQDLHGDNVLSASREPWLVIDPKPLGGEREFGLSPIIRSAEFGHSSRDVVHRLDRLTDDLSLDRERTRLWAFGHAIAWGFHEGKALRGHIETARFLLDA